MYEKSLEMSHFLVFPYPEEPGLASSWAARVARDRNDENGPTEVIGCILVGSREAKRKSKISYFKRIRRLKC